MNTPEVINIDSAFNWTDEVKRLWTGFDWNQLKSSACKVTHNEWEDRGNHLIFIGLCSSLLVDNAYYNWNIRGEDGEARRNGNILNEKENEWRNRQVERGDNEQNHGLNREAPHFRSPNFGQAGVVEAYGLYVNEWRKTDLVNKHNGILEKMSDGPAILLCPERIVEIYPTLMSIGKKFRKPLPLSSNPTLINLKMTLLHEMGHHFFPVHRSNASKYLSEGLANRFCFYGLCESEKPWLLYKTWHLQPPEYSAYRFVCLIESKCGNTENAITKAFDGEISSWDLMTQSKEWKTIDFSLEHTAMAISLDWAPSFGFILGLRIGMIRPLRGIITDTDVPADLIWDLYNTPIHEILTINGVDWREWNCPYTSSFWEEIATNKTKNHPIWAADAANFWLSLIGSCIRGDCDKVKDLRLRQKNRINNKDTDENTALMMAARYGHTDIVKLLINNVTVFKIQKREIPTDYSAKVQLTNIDGESALMMAARYGHTDIVKLLKNKGEKH